MQNGRYKGDDIKRNQRIHNLREQFDIESSYIDENDLNAALKIKDMLDQIEKLEENDVCEGFSSKAMYEKFKANYQEAAEKKIAERESRLENYNNEKGKFNYVVSYKPKFKSKRFAAAAAVVIICIASISSFSNITRTVASNEIFEPVVDLTDDVLNKSYVKKGSLPSASPKYKTIEDVENELNIEIMRLKNLPKGFSIDKIYVHTDEKSNKKLASFYYSKEDKFLTYTIRTNESSVLNPRISLEKNKDYSSIYKKDGIDYYILTNNNWPTATWSDSNIDYTLYGDLTKDELLKVVKNIRK